MRVLCFLGAVSSMSSSTDGRRGSRRSASLVALPGALAPGAANLELGDALLQPADQLRLGPLRMKRLCLITPHARKIPCTGQESCLRPSA